jgi:signal transduction histidine kinase
LVAFTAGSSFGFNRGLALLSDSGRLRGYFALGPQNSEEAVRVWRAINDKGITITDLLQFNRSVFEKEREKFRSALDRMDLAISQPPFKEAFETTSHEHIQYGSVIEVPADAPIPSALRDFYQAATFWVVPLFSHLRKPLGVVLLDNFLTNRRVSPEEKVVMEIFATEIALALERGLTYGELREKIEMLEDANRSIRDHQQTIIKLKEEAAVGEMVLQLTHTIKNPVVAIGGLARHMKKKLGEDAAFSKYATAIAQEASRLEETLRDFVKFVDLRYVAEHRPINLTQVLEVLVREKKDATGIGSPIGWHLDLKPVPPVLANERQLYNCLENIVNNALEAMSDGGELFLTCAHEDKLITLVIRDTGPGIPEETIKNLFKPFFTTKATGSGLGLYTSKQIIESLGGEMTVLCEQGKGCEVVIRLPVKEDS